MKLISIMECTCIHFNRQQFLATSTLNNRLFFQNPFRFDCEMVSMIHELFFRRKQFLCILDNDPAFCSFISDFLLHKVASHKSQKCQPLVKPFYDSEDFKDLRIDHYWSYDYESVMRTLKEVVLFLSRRVSNLDLRLSLMRDYEMCFYCSEMCKLVDLEFVLRKYCILVLDICKTRCSYGLGDYQNKLCQVQTQRFAVFALEHSNWDLKDLVDWQFEFFAVFFPLTFD